MSLRFFENQQLDSLNNPIYVIPKGTILYRGESSVNKPTYELPDSEYPVFFGFVKDDIEKNYGITYQFTTKQDIRCIAIDLLNKNSPFYKNSPPEIKKILKKNYGLVENIDSKDKIRLSESKNDKELAKYVCDSGYDGYAAPNMETQFDTFHAEIALCDASSKINQPGSRVTSSEYANKLKQEHALIKNDFKKQRRVRDVSPVKTSNFSSILFPDSPPSSPPRSPVTKSLFFDSPSPRKGGTIKNKKTRKTRKTRKTLRKNN